VEADLDEPNFDNLEIRNAPDGPFDKEKEDEYETFELPE
jgi:hypothetical protein